MGAKKFFSFLSSYDPITLAYVNGMTTKPSTAFIQVIDKYFVKNKKTVNGVTYTAKQLIAKADVMYLGNINNSNDSFRNIVKNSNHGAIQGSGLVFDPYWVWTNPAGTGYVDTNYNPLTQGVNYLKDNAGIIVNIKGDNTVPSANSILACVQAEGYKTQLSLSSTAGYINAALNDNAGSAIPFIPFMNGLFLVNRVSSSSKIIKNQNISNSTNSINSTGKPNVNFLLFRYTSSSPLPYLGSINFTYIGSSLTDDEFTALNLIVNEYLKECLYLKYGADNWGVKMAKSYFDTLHNFEPYEAWEIYEFIKRMQPDYVDGAGTGYYYNTFGPSGQNKTVADFIMLFKAGGNLLSNAWIKTGVLLRWNQDGTITSSNTMPAYIRGKKLGIVTVTSTDGWNGVTALTILQNQNSVNSFYGNMPLFIDKLKTGGSKSNVTCGYNRIKVMFKNKDLSLFKSGSFDTIAYPGYFKIRIDDIVGHQIEGFTMQGALSNANSEISGDVSQITNELIGSGGYILNNDNRIIGSLQNIILNPNSTIYYFNTTAISFGTSMWQKSIGTFLMQNAALNTAAVNAQLAVINAYFATNTPIKNVTINLSGSTMGIPTGGANNTDLLGIIAKHAAAGFTATITVRTS